MKIKDMKFNPTSMTAMGSLVGLGGFIYDRYIKGKKDLKSNILTALLFGGGGALADAAFTIGSDLYKKKTGKELIPDKAEDKRRDSVILKALGYCGAPLGGYGGFKLTDKWLAGRAAKAQAAADKALAEYLTKNPPLNEHNMAELAANMPTDPVTVRGLQNAAEDVVLGKLKSELKGGSLPKEVMGGKTTIRVQGPTTRNNVPKGQPITVNRQITYTSGGRGKPELRTYDVFVKAPTNKKPPSVVGKDALKAGGTLFGALLGHAVTSGLRNPEVRDNILRGEFSQALLNSL